MADAFQLFFGEKLKAADTVLQNRLASVEVEENADLPGAIQLLLPISTRGSAGAEDLTDVGDERFKPYGRVAVVATPDCGSDACIFDGYILSHRIHLDRSTTRSTLRVWGQDMSCLMNLKEVVKEWSNKTDGQMANDIFNKPDYPITPDTENNLGDDSGSHGDDAQTVMQRSTDAQFLRDRARRSGRVFRVSCDQRPGENKGYFVKPSLEGRPTVVLTLNPPHIANVSALDFAWDVARPSRVLAQALFKDDKVQKRDTKESGLHLLDSRSLGDFTGQGDKFVMEARLTATADSVSDLSRRATSVLREAGWFVRCEGEAELGRLKAVLRVATVVQINGAGKLHSGSYFVWSVRHVITAESHRMHFVLVRNAVGEASK